MGVGEESRSTTFAARMGTGARIGFAVLMVLTSFYGVLAYLPDTYVAFIQAPFQSWIPLLMRYHAVVFAIVTGGLCVTLWQESEGDANARRLVVEFAAFSAIFAAWSFYAKPFAGLRNESKSFVWALALVFGVLWVGIIDWHLYWKRRRWLEKQVASIRIAPVIATAVVIGLAYPGAAFLRNLAAGYGSGLEHGMLFVWGGAVVAHVLFFATIFGAVALLESVAAKTRRPEQVRFVLLVGFGWICVWLIFQRIAFPAIPFQGTEAAVYSAWIGLAMAVFGGGLALRISPKEGTKAPEQVKRRGLEFVLLVIVLGIGVYVIPAVIGVIDWNSILEKTWVLVFWAAALFAVFRFAGRRERPANLIPALLVPVLAYGVYAPTFELSRWSSPDAPVYGTVGKYAYYDVSYATIRDLFALDKSLDCDELCGYLHEQTNIPPSMPGAAPEIRLVDRMTTTTGERPNIFIIVVDSLARDFVAPYAASADTPEIAAFAKDSVVFRNAFSRYAGTTLAEPSIWAGAVLLHTHFPQPFSHVNNLEKLVATDGYEPYVTVDTTLRVLGMNLPGLVPLDTDAQKWTDVDACGTLDEMATKLSRRADASRPIFMYTQPQDVHLLTVQKRHPEMMVHTREALAAAYSQELKRVDGCFGKFVRMLKSRNLYDNSVIVLTADHGEFGHDSHATSVEPEIMRVPLMMHVPERVRAKYHFDADGVAFTTDITPTLYYLLGHRPIRNDEVLGRPLFTETAEEAAQYKRDTYMVSSSYAPNYGLLRENGRMMFTVDDRKRSYALYDIAQDPTGDKNLLQGKPDEADKQAIRKHVEHLASVYNFTYKPPTLLKWLLQ